jgi:hypothetical protein
MNELAELLSHGHVIRMTYSKVAMEVLGALSLDINALDTMMTVCELFELLLER